MPDTSLTKRQRTVLEKKVLASLDEHHVARSPTKYTLRLNERRDKLDKEKNAVQLENYRQQMKRQSQGRRSQSMVDLNSVKEAN